MNSALEPLTFHEGSPFICYNIHLVMLISIPEMAHSILPAGFMARSPNQHHFISPLVMFANATIGSWKSPLEICQHKLVSTKLPNKAIAKR